ncbi:semaphorin 5c-like [Oratosquilla oratoria]|uniref:semaphorin 5c-like n=1 Tax=Oratosquilla oratoria TaxID=337810 RepID=UPI003F776A51
MSVQLPPRHPPRLKRRRDGGRARLSAESLYMYFGALLILLFASTIIYLPHAEALLHPQSSWSPSVRIPSIRDEVNDFRYVSHNELVREMDRFGVAGISNYTELLFDPTNYQLIVGARDRVFRLSLTGLQQLESSDWSANHSVVRSCYLKGGSDRYCRNYVRVLHLYGNRILACGTYACYPFCTWRKLSHIDDVEEWVTGTGRTPTGPDYSVASLMTQDGNLYVGTYTDFAGLDPIILRTLGSDKQPRTPKYDAKWLSRPSFVASFESSGFVYFIFKEDAVEHLTCGKRVYSRISRVCKNDQGGKTRTLRNRWTTFAKARLLCSREGAIPFSYDHVRSVSYLPREQMIYAVFNTAENGIPGSAVCVFNMTAVNSTFDGPFIHQASSTSSSWSPVTLDNRHFKCQETGMDNPAMSDKYQLMEGPVVPETPSPVYQREFETLTHIAVDVVATRLYEHVHVMFVAARDNTIRKLSVLPRTQQTCLLEVLNPFPANSSNTINSFKFLKDTNSLYVGTDEGVLRIPSQRCSRFRSKAACLGAMDPYCGWDTTRLECTTAPHRNPLDESWIQEVIDCPKTTDPVDGDWSAWSDWEPCRQSGSEDNCLCRRRHCDSPRPSNGGLKCSGSDLEVTNCTVHGDWTAWSSWSQCSATCGIAVKSRRRTCTNPEPKHGGRLCVGQERTEIYCHFLPPCPVYSAPPVDGGWSTWGSWSSCSERCGGGVRTRRRTCSSPVRRNGGADCAGCEEDTESCNGGDCPELQRPAPWTQWLTVNSSETEVLQRRFKVMCSAAVREKEQLRPATVSHEDRVCTLDGRCSSRPGYSSSNAHYFEDNEEAAGGWTNWSEWSVCDKMCGSGRQQRRRICVGSPCLGAAREEKECNTQSCSGSWSCWSDWSACTVSCGEGVQQRRRKCTSPHNEHVQTTGCVGPYTSEQPCHRAACQGQEGWGEWAEWSVCSDDGERLRRRRCESYQPSSCRGLDTQRQTCLPLDATTLQSRGSGYPESSGSLSVQTAVGGFICCFIAGAIVGALAVYYVCVRRRRRRVPSSPLYLPSRPNHYVSVPGSEWKADQTPNGTLKTGIKNGLKNAITTLPLKEFDTATIKRSSHGSYASGSIRADLGAKNIFDI